MGEGVLASRPGGEKGFALSFSAVSARATTRDGRGAGARARPQRAVVGAFKEKGMMSGDGVPAKRSKTPQSQRSLVSHALMLHLLVRRGLLAIRLHRGISGIRQVVLDGPESCLILLRVQNSSSRDNGTIPLSVL
jgi:hypothetical protein